MEGAEISPHQEVEDRPQLGQPVLDGGPGNGDPVDRVDALDRLRALCGRILDLRGLVEQEVVEGNGSDDIDVPGDGGVG